jgi:hypothetical protein
MVTILKLLYELSNNIEGECITHDLSVNKNTVMKWRGIVRETIVIILKLTMKTRCFNETEPQKRLRLMKACSSK